MKRGRWMILTLLLLLLVVGCSTPTGSFTQSQRECLAECIDICHDETTCVKECLDVKCDLSYGEQPKGLTSVSS